MILSGATCLQKIVSSMSNFVSPFLARLIYVCCSLSYLTAANNQRNKQHQAALNAAALDTVPPIKQNVNNMSLSSISQLDSKLALLRSTLATQIPLRLLAPILSQQSITMYDQQPSAATESAEFKMRLKYVEFYMQIAR